MYRIVCLLHFLLTLVFFLIYFYLGFEKSSVVLIFSSILSLLLYFKKSKILYILLYNLTFFGLTYFSGGLFSFDSWFLFLGIYLSYLYFENNKKIIVTFSLLTFSQFCFLYFNYLNEINLYYKEIYLMSQITFFINIFIIYFLKKKEILNEEK